MSWKVAFISLGCAKNLVNTEQMMALCRQAGFTVTGEPEGGTTWQITPSVTLRVTAPPSKGEPYFPRQAGSSVMPRR